MIEEIILYPGQQDLILVKLQQQTPWDKEFTPQKHTKEVRR